MRQALSEWTREQIKRHCRTIFEAAVNWQFILANPFKVVKLKKLATSRWHRVKMSEYRALLEATPDLRTKTLYALAYTTGARLGELLALTWSNIDFERGRLEISNREAKADMPPFRVKDHESRQIPMPRHTIDLLTALQAEAEPNIPYVLLDKARYEIVRAKWHELRKDGEPWRNRYMANNTLRDFKAHCKRAGIRPDGKLTFHTLRKSCGQNWADNLPMNVAKELMGHAKVETTLEFYNQVDKYHEKKAADVLEKLFEASESVKKQIKNCAKFAPKGLSEENKGK